MKEDTKGKHNRQGRSSLLRIPCVWHETYHSEAATWLSTRKQRDVVAQADGEGLIEAIPAAPFDEERTWAFLKTIHDPTYVEAVRTGNNRSLAESQGFTWSPQFATSVVHITEGHLLACELALQDGLVFHPVSGAHHADFCSGGGFCTFNFLVAAGLALLEQRQVGKVMIIDLDAHQGDGTFRMVASTPAFLLFDFASANWLGHEEFGPRACFHVVRDAEEYMTVLHSQLATFLDAMRPDLVQYQAGMDPHERDHMGGVRGMSWALLAERDEFVIREVRKRRIPLIVNLAGGYQEGGTTVSGHVATFRQALKVERALKARPGAPSVERSKA